MLFEEIGCTRFDIEHAQSVLQFLGRGTRRRLAYSVVGWEKSILYVEKHCQFV